MQTLAQAALAAVAEMRERGPSRAARLVAYRCAALGALVPMRCKTIGFATGSFDADGTRSVGHEVATESESYAHAMLAAEREPPS